MPAKSPNQKEVYFACRSIFRGGEAKRRRLKAVSELLKKNNDLIRHLLVKHSFPQVADVVRKLLELQIFEEPSKAQRLFPDLFQSSQLSKDQRMESEDKVATCEVEALATAASSKNEDDVLSDKAILADVEAVAERISFIPEKDQSERVIRSQKKKHITAKDTVPLDTPRPHSLFPAYLPYKLQHHVLTKVQSLLEECCWEFSLKWLPQIASELNWDCPEALELNVFTPILAKQGTTLPLTAFNGDGGIDQFEAFFVTNEIRHAAVHRLRISAAGIQRMVAASIRMAQTLNDIVRATELATIDRELACCIEDMELNKQFLERRLDDQLEALAEAKAELLRKEEQAVVAMLQDDEEHKLYVSGVLNEKLSSLNDNVGKQSATRESRAAYLEGRAKENTKCAKGDGSDDGIARDAVKAHARDSMIEDGVNDEESPWLDPVDIEECVGWF
ncbi:MAG: hypothetical protein M1827_004892 [Pycnora praestabilis]|nr:MAG: hypothetical protein M1827_004892 [Pycnora praestabilis]